MKIFFSCSTKNLLHHKDSYTRIRSTVLDAGHEITRDWLLNALYSAETGATERPRSEVYQQTMDAILAADLVIFDASVPSMSIGHQLTFAIDRGKPTLLLYGDGASKEDLFIGGSKHPLLHIQKYTTIEEAERSVKKFISTNLVKSKTRFNLVLDRSEYDYVSWAAFRYNLNKTDVIKRAIRDKAVSDEEYKDFSKENL